ncbi:MAG: hypothetical protein QOJ99_2672 [Bryobacterales bacterium]|jgi:hypothetical protein|nr:hypothetical protein [Bryobacterales bacterium]
MASLRLRALSLAAQHSDVLAWIADQVGDGPAMLAIDAPTIIRNAAGQRPGERLLNAGFRKYGLGVSSGESWTAFCGEDNRVLAGLRDLWLPARSRDNTANARPVYRLGYNKGSVAERAVQLKRLRQYLYSLKDCEQPCVLAKLPAIPAGGIARKRRRPTRRYFVRLHRRALLVPGGVRGTVCSGIWNPDFSSHQPLIPLIHPANKINLLNQ